MPLLRDVRYSRRLNPYTRSWRAYGRQYQPGRAGCPARYHTAPGTSLSERVLFLASLHCEIQHKNIDAPGSSTRNHAWCLFLDCRIGPWSCSLRPAIGMESETMQSLGLTFTRLGPGGESEWRRSVGGGGWEVNRGAVA
eukprot:3716904-Rhodomonas_salina.1